MDQWDRVNAAWAQATATKREARQSRLNLEVEVLIFGRSVSVAIFGFVGCISIGARLIPREVKSYQSSGFQVDDLTRTESAVRTEPNAARLPYTETGCYPPNCASLDFNLAIVVGLESLNLKF